MLLHHHPLSSNAQKAQLMLDVVGADYELREVPFEVDRFYGQPGMAKKNLTLDWYPVGTGPYRFVEFRPGDIVRGERNPDYHLPNRPYFDTVEMKGGGDAVSAARAVLATSTA